MNLNFYFVYILRSLRDSQFYIGFTNNLERRFREHNEGKNISTASRRPLELIFYEAYLNKSDAERRENYFKTNKGKTTLRQMLREFLR
ncbi:GIY-YIG nuclease family protein [Candidatus Peregrinibacteria bacterium]|nr:GIY-YIG nuclease family protein [Candidatus Peregrinibacteria bacterium]